MKFFHLADLHLGKVVHGFSMLADQRYVLEQVLQAAHQQRPAAVLLAGDLYDRRVPSGGAVALLNWFLTQLAEAHIPCLAIAGNHDSGVRIGFASKILEKQGLYLAGTATAELPHVRFTQDNVSADVWLLPFLRPAEGNMLLPEAHIQSYDDAVRALLAEQTLDANVCNILVAHQFVTGAGVIPERSESEVVTVGGVDYVDCAAFAAFDYVALGHLHGPQPVGGRCRYAGSPLPYSFSEANQDKSITVIQVDAAHTCSISTLPLTPLHPMRELRGPLEELVKPDIVASGSPEDYLRVTLTDEREPENAASRLRAVYPNLMRLEFDNRRTRQGELQLDEDWEEELPLEALFAEFFEKQNGRALEPESLVLLEQMRKEADEHT